MDCENNCEEQFGVCVCVPELGDCTYKPRDIEIENDEDYRRTIRDEFDSLKETDWYEFYLRSVNIINDISKFIEKNKINYVPLTENIFNAFKKTKFKNLKCIIWGQDPYHQLLENGEPRAQGFSFSVKRDDKIPVSLKNIYKELEDNYPTKFKKPAHGDLTKWCEQGVMLLNSALTTEPDKAGSHCVGSKYGPIWRPFINEFIDYLNEKNPNIIHVLWGAKAKDEVSNRISKKSKVLESAHPSGFSYSKFKGNKHFLAINSILKEQKIKKIDWNVD